MSDETTVVVAKTRTRRNYNVTAKEFCDIWQDSNSAQEVADKVSKLSISRGKLAEGETISKAVISARAHVYRHAGVTLKKMPKNRRNKLDVAELNSRIETPNF